jgi:AraC-like DNA-binding protein
MVSCSIACSATAQPASVLTLPKVEGEPLTAWRTLFAGVFAVDEVCARKLSAKPGVDFVARATGTFILSEAKTPSMRLVRSTETLRRCGADGFAIHAQFSGDIAGRMGDRSIRLQAGDIIFVDLLQTLDLQISAATATDSVTLWMSRAKMLASLGPGFDDESALHGFAVTGDSPAGALIGGSLRLLAQQAAKLTSVEMDALANGVTELTLKAVAPSLARIGGVNGRTPLASYVTLRRHIDRHLKSPTLGVDTLATTFGLSRASLYRLFEPAGGVASYIRKARLNRAWQEIVAAEYANHRIGPIVYRLGFKNLSAFNRLFKESYGVSPKQARERASQEVGGAFSCVLPGEGPSLGGWLARLGRQGGPLA